MNETVTISSFKKRYLSELLSISFCSKICEIETTQNEKRKQNGPVNVLLHVTWEVIVEHVGHVVDVNAAASHV
jgi:hypothetical protein